MRVVHVPASNRAVEEDALILRGTECGAGEKVSRSEAFGAAAMGTVVFLVLVTTMEDAGVLERVA